MWGLERNPVLPSGAFSLDSVCGKDRTEVLKASVDPGIKGLRI